MSERDKRYPAKFPVVLRKGPEMYAATLCNISEGGGCILGAPIVKQGETFVLDYGSGQTRATAMWTMARMTGLRFDSRLSRNGVNSIRVLTEPV